MEELLKNIFFAGIGSLAITYEKSREIIDDLIKKGKITVEQGKEINEELKRNFKKEDIIDESNLVTKDDFNEILKRIEVLEKENEKE